MHRAGQRCFELLALIGSPQFLEQSYSPAFFFLWIFVKFGSCGSVMEVILNAADTFEASTGAQSDDCLPANSKQRTRYRILSALSASDC